MYVPDRQIDESRKYKNHRKLSGQGGQAVDKKIVRNHPISHYPHCPRTTKITYKTPILGQCEF